MVLRKVRKKILFKICGNSFAQRLLDKRITRLQRLTGVGSGGSVATSGEFAVLKKLKDLKGQPCCIFDVGANKGDFAELALSYFGSDEVFFVHCFEPSKAAFAVLYRNMAANTHVVANNLGLGKDQGKFDLFTDFPGSGGASLTKRNLEHLGTQFSQSEKVEIDTLDNYCRAKKIQKIDLLKIDVEGHELDVLNGAVNMFSNNSIGMVTFEFGGCNIDTRTFFRDFYYFFKDLNFSLYRITPAGYFYPLPCYKESYEQFRTTNFLAVRQE